MILDVDTVYVAAIETVCTFLFQKKPLKRVKMLFGEKAFVATVDMKQEN